MNENLAEVLNTLSHYIPQDLISNRWIEKLIHITNDLPGQISDSFGFESILNNSLASVDFALSIAKTDIGLITGSHPHISLPKEYFKVPYWKRLINFLSQVEAKNTELFQSVNNIWLEYDLEKEINEIPVVFRWKYGLDLI